MTKRRSQGSKSKPKPRMQQVELPNFSDSIRVFRVLEGKPPKVRVRDDQTFGAMVPGLAKAFARPGIRKEELPGGDDVPFFRAHPTRRGFLIRSYKSGKREQVGTLDASGKFKPAE